MNTDPFLVRPATHQKIRRRFGAVYRAEHLPIEEVKSATWFASEVAAGALVRVSGTKCRIKGTVTLPEWRGMGAGEAVLRCLIDYAVSMGYESVEVYTRRPGWYLRHGFTEDRLAPWGTAILVADLRPRARAGDAGDGEPDHPIVSPATSRAADPAGPRHRPPVEQRTS